MGEGFTEIKKPVNLKLLTRDTELKNVGNRHVRFGGFLSSLNWMVCEKGSKRVIDLITLTVVLV